MLPRRNEYTLWVGYVLVGVAVADLPLHLYFGDTVNGPPGVDALGIALLLGLVLIVVGR